MTSTAGLRLVFCFALPFALAACDGESGVPCGDVVCDVGDVCCAGCAGEEPTCGTSCPDVQCAEDGGTESDAGGADEDAGPSDEDAGPNDDDAGPSDTDAGPESDAGPAADSGPAPDAGSATDGGSASDAGPAGQCVAQEVMGMGDCDFEFGPFFLGDSCGSVTGCNCVGAGCSMPFASQAECDRLNRGCTVGCGAQQAMGMGACELILGTFWDGTQCRTISGCTCRGDDCDNGYAGMVECARAHRACP